MEVDEAVILLAEAITLMLTLLLAARLTIYGSGFSPPPPAQKVLAPGEYVVYYNSTACLLVSAEGVASCNTTPGLPEGPPEKPPEIPRPRPGG